MLAKIPLSNRDRNRGLHLPSRMTKELAYILGVFAGDGSLNYRKHKHEYSLKCVGNPRDEQEFYHEVIQPLFTKVFGLTPKVKLHDKGTTFGLTLYSKTLVSSLVELGLPLGPKHPSLHIPEAIKGKFLVYFVRGLFDTDGCICFKKRYRKIPYYPVISFTSKTESFTREIKEFLKYQGFMVVSSYNYRVRDHRNKKGHTIINRLELNGQKNLQLWQEKIGFFNPKHLEKIKKWKE